MRSVLLSLVVGLSALAAQRPAPAHYSLVKRFPVGGEGFWDYLAYDAQGNRLFVSRQDRVLVISADSGAELGVIPDTQGVHGIALAPKLGRGFISDGKANAVTVFDLKTLKRIEDLPVTGENPDAIVYEPRHARVLTMNGRSKNATVIDAKTLKVVATLPLPGRPEFAVADGHGHVFANIEDLAHLVEIDVATPKLLADWDLAPCEGPSGLARDARHHRLFSVCHNQQMIVVDDRNGKVVAQVPIGNGPDASLFDARRGLAFSPNGRDGTITVVREATPDRFEVVQTIATQKSARTAALDPKTGRIFLSAAELGERPAPTPEHPHPRPPMKPNSFAILVVAPER